MSFKTSGRDIDVDDLMRELMELRQRLDDFSPSTYSTDCTMPEVVIKKIPAQKIDGLKPTMFPVYDGDRQTYPAWRKAIRSVLKIDRNTSKYTDSR
ncbi:hypothetical protein GcC1_123024, partial [Golovinomyces cichoracearum]